MKPDSFGVIFGQLIASWILFRFLYFIIGPICQIIWILELLRYNVHCCFRYLIDNKHAKIVTVYKVLVLVKLVEVLCVKSIFLACNKILLCYSIENLDTCRIHGLMLPIVGTMLGFLSDSLMVFVMMWCNGLKGGNSG